MIFSAIDAPNNMTNWLFAGEDGFLITLNIFNLFVLWAHHHAVESPLKKSALITMETIVAPFHAVPFLPTLLLSKTVVISAVAGFYAYKSADTIMIVRALVAAYTFLETSIFMKLSNVQIKLGVDKIMEIEQEVATHDMINFEPPSKTTARAITAPLRSFLRTDVTGMERIPHDEPHLFVMNHSLYGLEMPLFVDALYREKNIFVRGLADRFHFAFPYGSILKRFGAFNGTRDNVQALMECGQNVLVYPGGGHEIMKPSTIPRYELMWKERLGFARLAIKNKYPIIPCAAVGTEDMLRTVLDIPADVFRKGQFIPIAVASPHKVQKIYFWFGDPIPTEEYNGDYENDDCAREVRDKVKAAIEGGIREMQAKQESDPDRYLMTNYTASLKRALSQAYNSLYASLSSFLRSRKQTASN